MPNSQHTNTATADQTIQELASARALSALCGGSGVGQAPEPPQSAERSEQLTVNYQQLTKKRDDIEFLPKAPISLQETSEKLKAKSEKTTYEVGERRESEQEKKIIARENIKISKSEKSKKLTESRIKNLESRIKKINLNSKFQIPDSRRFFRFVATAASYACILIAFVGFCFAYGPVIQAELKYGLKNQNSKIKIQNDNAKFKNNSVKILPKTAMDEFKNINFPSDTSIVIPKIDAVAEIIPNVDPANYEEYMAALQKGVAHAKGTALPGMKGNSYLFAHSAGNLFDIARFNAVFYLISKLEKNDAIYVKFGNEKFKYVVIDKKEVEANDVQFLTGNLEGVEGINGIEEGDRTLILQTCVPPGTDWRRLLVFAKIEK